MQRPRSKGTNTRTSTIITPKQDFSNRLNLWLFIILLSNELLSSYNHSHPDSRRSELLIDLQVPGLSCSQDLLHRSPILKCLFMKVRSSNTLPGRICIGWEGLIIDQYLRIREISQEETPEKNEKVLHLEVHLTPAPLKHIKEVLNWRTSTIAFQTEGLNWRR